MKLKAVLLENFRCYGVRTRIGVGEFTTFIGKNDFGKSSILEALEIFFNGETVKIEKDDRCVSGQDSTVRIGCVFTDLPEKLVIDVDAATNLRAEHLLNKDGDLEVIKEYDCGKSKLSETVVAVAMHPSAEDYNDLLLLKNTDLKSRLKTFKIDTTGVNQSSNVSMRQAIWEHLGTPALAETRIPLDKEGAKQIWEQLKQHLPSYALFQADRMSSDEDSEVQDPMKLAVKEALETVQTQLQAVTKTISEKATEVAEQTLAKLKEMDPELAKKLSPVFRSEPKWDTLFKLALKGDEGIPVNKRGSGVRRLILLSFFRAAAERESAGGHSGIIYAIEEPETSQHPSNQEMLVRALQDLSEREGRQVIVTTHVPGLAGLVGIDNLRYVGRDNAGNPTIRQGDEGTLQQIADELGVLPDARVVERVQVIVCLEGPNDACFFGHASLILRGRDSSLPDISGDQRLLVLPLGGSNLKDWVLNNRLRTLGKLEAHIYDRGDDNPPKYQGEADAVNARRNGSWAVLTRKREIENYLHPDAIRQALAVSVQVEDQNDVPLAVARDVHEGSSSAVPWDQLDSESKKQKEGKVKKKLNEEVIRSMTYEQLSAMDPSGEIQGWLRKIGGMLK